VAKDPNLPDGLQLGPMGYRVIAAVFDLLLVFFSWFAVIRFWGHYNEAQNSYLVTGFPALALMTATPIYWFSMEWFFGATVGKLICDLRVVSLTGKKCSLGQSLKRNLLRPIDFFPWYLVGFIAVKLSPLRQRLGDQWAKTIVVKKDRKPLPEATQQVQPPFA
jgi:uncharacterized RDD family membrane protein YckC